MSLWTPLRAKPCNRRKWRYCHCLPRTGVTYNGLSHQNVTGALSSLRGDGSMTSGLCILLDQVGCHLAAGERRQLTTCSGRRWSPSDQYRAALRSLLLTGPAGQLWARAAAGAGDGESRRPSSVARARGLARLTALVRVATMVAPQPRPGPHTAQHAAHHRHLITTTAIQLETKVIRRFPKISQSRRRPLIEPSPGWKRLIALAHLRHY